MFSLCCMKSVERIKDISEFSLAQIKIHKLLLALSIIQSHLSSHLPDVVLLPSEAFFLQDLPVFQINLFGNFIE